MILGLGLDRHLIGDDDRDTRDLFEDDEDPWPEHSDARCAPPCGMHCHCWCHSPLNEIDQET